MNTRNKLVNPEWLYAVPHHYTLTNGCFDILHPGHVDFLESITDHPGGEVVVAINDDESVRKLKGPTRPINKAKDRARVVASLGCVDYVIIFSETDVVQLLRNLRPANWVKGGDYTMDSLNQEEVQAAYAAHTRIVLKPMLEGYSTTKTIQAMQTN